MCVRARGRGEGYVRFRTELLPVLGHTESFRPVRGESDMEDTLQSFNSGDPKRANADQCRWCDNELGSDRAIRMGVCDRCHKLLLGSGVSSADVLGNYRDSG